MREHLAIETMTTTYPAQQWITSGTVGDPDALLTPEHLGLVLELLATKGRHERIRAQVNQLKRDYLLELHRNGQPLLEADTKQPILTPEHDWTADVDSFRSYCAELNKRERAAGIKPEAMGDEYCPSLVAGNKAVLAERALINATAPLFGIRPTSLGVEKGREWVELVSSAVLSWAREHGAL